MELRLSSLSTYFLSRRRTRSCARSMSGFNKVKVWLQKPILIEFCQWKWWTKFRSLQRNRKEVKRYFFKTRKEMQLTSRGWSPDSSCTLVQVRKRHGTLKSIQMTQKENGMKWQSKSRKCILYRSIQSWKDVSISRKENSRKEVQTCISTPMIHLQKMMMYLITSAIDLCFVFGICDYLGKVNEIDIENQRHTACSLSKSLWDRHSASTLTLCCWKCLTFYTDSGGKPLSKNILFGEYLACIQRKNDGRGESNKEDCCRKSERKARRRTSSTV